MSPVGRPPELRHRAASGKVPRWPVVGLDGRARRRAVVGSPRHPRLHLRPEPSGALVSLWITPKTRDDRGGSGNPAQEAPDGTDARTATRREAESLSSTRPGHADGDARFQLRRRDSTHLRTGCRKSRLRTLTRPRSPHPNFGPVLAIEGRPAGVGPRPTVLGWPADLGRAAAARERSSPTGGASGARGAATTAPRSFALVGGPHGIHRRAIRAPRARPPRRLPAPEPRRPTRAQLRAPASRGGRPGRTRPPRG